MDDGTRQPELGPDPSAPLDEEELERLARELAGAYERAGEATPEELASALEPGDVATDCAASEVDPIDEEGLDRLVDAYVAAQAGDLAAERAAESDGQQAPADENHAVVDASADVDISQEGSPEVQNETVDVDGGIEEAADEEVEDVSFDEPDFTPDLVQVVEGLLFVGGRPLQPVSVAEVLGDVTEQEVVRAIELLKRRYEQQGRPYRVVREARGYRLVLDRSFARYGGVVRPRRKAIRLSQAAIDVLAIVAYKQPVGLREIDAMRGLDSAGVLRQLVRRGLVRPVPGADGHPRRTLYETTPAFLRAFRLTSLADLPRIDPAEATPLPPPPHRRPSERPTSAKAESTGSAGNGRSG